jgi:8-oxo-dGTP pyrophosphatase MutT (NUDIX family)
MKVSKDAQAVIIRRGIHNKLFFLVIKRFDKDKQEDHYRLVKGGVEEGESSKETIQREVFEEVGIKKIDTVEFLSCYEYVGNDIKHEVDVFLLAVGNADEKLSPGSSNEGGFIIKDAVWLNKEKAINKLNFTDEKRMIEKAVSKLLTV